MRVNSNQKSNNGTQKCQVNGNIFGLNIVSLNLRCLAFRSQYGVLFQVVGFSLQSSRAIRDHLYVTFVIGCVALFPTSHNNSK